MLVAYSAHVQIVTNAAVLVCFHVFHTLYDTICMHCTVLAWYSVHITSGVHRNYGMKSRGLELCQIATQNDDSKKCVVQTEQPFGVNAMVVLPALFVHEIAIPH